MIGYSDSNKDGGISDGELDELFCAERLSKVCDGPSVKLMLFHERGGRWAGAAGPKPTAPSWRSRRNRCARKVTEQGEVISSRYSSPDIARWHLEQLVNAVLLTSGRRPRHPESESWLRGNGAR